MDDISVTSMDMVSGLVMHQLLIKSILVIGCFVSISGCTSHLPPSQVNNPAPTKPFSQFSAYELKPLKVSDEIRDSEPQVLERLDEIIASKVLPLTSQWGSASPLGRGSKGTLIIAPELKKLKFVNTNERIWGGDVAASSSLSVHIKFYVKGTNIVISEADFSQKADAWASAWNGEESDRVLLDRVSDLIATYLSNNYEQAIGGPGGIADDEASS